MGRYNNNLQIEIVHLEYRSTNLGGRCGKGNQEFVLGDWFELAKRWFTCRLRFTLRCFDFIRVNFKVSPGIFSHVI